MLLEVMDDIIIEYPDTKDFIRQKLSEKCDREGISIDKVILFFYRVQKENIFTNQACHILKSTLLLAGLKVQFFNQKRLGLQ